jgi:Helix-turn-helix domain
VSVQAMSWVIEKSRQKGSNLLVLLMIANHADTTGVDAYPKVETLAAESRLSERAVRYILAKLARSSELVIESNAGPYGCHRYSLPGVTRDGFNLRGLPANFAGRKQQGSAQTGGNLPAKFAPNCGNLPAKAGNSSGNSYCPRTEENRNQRENLRPLTRPNPPTCGNLGPDDSEESQKPWLGKGKGRKKTAATPQRRRYAITRRLTEAATEILHRKPGCPHSDLAEELKQWAAKRGVPYFDAWPGAATPIEQAITIATARRKTA